MLDDLFRILIDFVSDLVVKLFTRIGIVKLILIILIAIIVIGLIFLLIKQSFF